MIVKFKDFINFDKRLGKMIIAGEEGSGKTLLLTAIAISKMLHGLEDYWKSCEEIDKYNSLGFKFSKKFDHTCFSNFDINCRGTNIPDRRVYRCNPYRLGLFDEIFETDFYPPYSLFCITEAYNVFNSYLYDKFRDSFKAFIKTSRHGKYDMVLDTQCFSDICTLFRRINNRFIYLDKEVEMIENIDGVVIGHKLHVIEFNKNRDVEYFERTSKLQNAKEYDLVIDRCLFENYDTEYCKYLHLQGREMQDFCIEEFETIKSKEDIADLLVKFGLVAPDGFFKAKRVDIKKPIEIEDEENDEDFNF